jgi:hypothetical protein
VKVVVGNSGSFTVHLAPGTWFATGRSPMFHVNGREAECSANKAVTVAAGKTVTVQVQCIGK